MGIQNKILWLSLVGWPAWASSPVSSGVRALLENPSELAFVEGFQKLSIEDRSELVSLLATDLAGWSALAELPSVLLANPKDKSLGLRENLVSWLRESPSQGGKELANLKYIGLTQYPVETKIKLEKGKCLPQPTSWLRGWELVRESVAQDFSHAPGETHWSCHLKTKWPQAYDWLKYVDAQGCEATPERQPQNVNASESRPCNRELTVGLAIDLLGEAGIFEENVGKFNTEQIIGSIQSEESWAAMHKRFGLALERLYTKLPKYSQSLVERIRLADLAHSALTQDEFMLKRKLANFLVSNNSSESLGSCDLLANYFQNSGDKAADSLRSACPDLGTVSVRSVASLTPVSLAESNQVQGTAQAVAYYTQIRKIYVDSLGWLKRVESPLAQPGSLLTSNMNGVLSEGVTSELAATLLPMVLSARDSSAVDIEGEAARVVIETMKDSVLKKGLANEQARLAQLLPIWESVQKALDRLLPVESSDRELVEKVRLHARISAALLKEIRTRLPASVPAPVESTAPAALDTAAPELVAPGAPVK